jgi:hypothetical protein
MSRRALPVVRKKSLTTWVFYLKYIQIVTAYS